MYKPNVKDGLCYLSTLIRKFFSDICTSQGNTASFCIIDFQNEFFILMQMKQKS